MTAVLDQASELEKLLLEHNVTIFGYERLDQIAVVRFILNGQKLRLVVAMPDWESDEYKLTPNRREIRSVTERRRLYWKDVSTKWRAMKNLIAAKLEGIDAGITTFESEFRQFEDAKALITAGETQA
jgi:hypothetical protein